jgi:hypothetical protein
MEKPIIIIPSRKRAKSVLTKCTDSILLVDEIESDEYKKFNDIEIHTHKSLKNLAQIRQFAIEKYNNVFFIDDDIVSVEKLWLTSNAKLTDIEIRDLIYKTYNYAKQIEASLYGFNTDPNPTHYAKQKPFELNGYINGCAFGINENKNLFFNKHTTACESHWITLLNAHYNRFCFIDKRYHFRQKANSTFISEGGQAGKRTIESEKKDTLILKKYFGESVILKKEKNKTNQLHQYQRQIKLKI